MKILLMGPPACGKGTQGEKLSASLGLPLITSGQLLRDLPDTNPENQEMHRIMNSGGLPDNHAVAKVIIDRVSNPDCAKGYILDGWGRRATDLEAFDPGFNAIVLINIPREESLRRITGRRMCVTDGKLYNINTLPPEELEKCKGDLVQREDDKEDVVNKRLDIYETETRKTVNRVRDKGILVEVDGMGTPDEIFGRILSALELKFQK